MIRMPLRLGALALALTGVVAVSACGDTEDDVVQTPAGGGAPQPVSETRADVATTSAAFAYGMTREQLEDADILSAQNTDLGDVETLVLGPDGALTHVVVDLEGPGDFDVVVPQGQLRSIAQNNAQSVDLTTDLTADQLRALPRWEPNAAR